MMFHMRSGSKDQLTLPQRVFSPGIFFPPNYSGTFSLPFCFYFLEGFFVPAEHISIKVSFFWERKRGKGSLGFGCGDVLFCFFPFQFPLIRKNNNMVGKVRKGFVYSSNNKACPLHCSSSK